MCIGALAGTASLATTIQPGLPSGNWTVPAHTPSGEMPSLFGFMTLPGLELDLEVQLLASEAHGILNGAEGVGGVAAGVEAEISRHPFLSSSMRPTFS